jgi:drug/metabolite transporter (DMT)-like permease
MPRVRFPLLPCKSRPFGLAPLALGTAFCIASALAYTGANACLKHLAGLADNVWTICVKESVTVAAVGPWLLWQTARGRKVWPSSSEVAVLALVGLAVELIGNLGMLWAMQVVGLSVAIPAVSATNLAVSALFGWVLLGEGVRPRTMLAIGLLMTAVALLSFQAGRPSLSSREPLHAALALGAACLAGAIFAGMIVAIRKTVTGVTPPEAVMFMICLMGVLSLGPLSLCRVGGPGLLATSPRLMLLMLWAGLLNLVGFFCLTRGLQLASVVRANLLSASQVAMAAVAGFAVFGERPGIAAIHGILLTIVGMMLVERPRSDLAMAEAEFLP